MNAPEYKEAQQRLADAKALYANKMAERKADIATAKARRDERRASGPISKDEEAAMIKESQHMKAELRRFKKESDQTLAALTEEVEHHRSRIEALRHRRSEMSDELQKWLFAQYRMLNARGEVRDITDIFLEKPERCHPLEPATAALQNSCNMLTVMDFNLYVWLNSGGATRRVRRFDIICITILPAVRSVCPSLRTCLSDWTSNQIRSNVQET